jgi:hypothetical protein
MVLREACCVYVFLSWPAMYMYVHTTQRSCNLDIKSYLRLRYIKSYCIL